MERLKAYKFRIYPTEEQALFFAKTFGCVRKVYNLMLYDRIQSYQKSQKVSKGKITFPTPAQYKKEYPFLKEVDSLALANAQLNLDRAYKNFFRDKSVGFPRFKSKKNPVQSYTTNNQNGTIFLIKNKYIKLPKIKDYIRVKIHRQPEGIIRSATISYHSSGIYYISLLYKEEIIALPKTGLAIGIERGMNNFIVLSDGRKVNNMLDNEKMRLKLKQEQRKLARRMVLTKNNGVSLSEAKNYQKQKQKVARLYVKITNQQRDFLNKLTTEIIKNYDIICIKCMGENNKPSNPKLTHRMLELSWSSFISKLQYKASWCGRELIIIDTGFKASEICSRYGSKDGKKMTNLAEWIYPICDTSRELGIDSNKNILIAGQKNRN
ncbi:transposase, IS605 OrfB family [Listeria ivanovii subsp. londoniensis]|uniref:Transposase n=1 Tax=Listeria ivanovii TaxID=1638 RepID=A0AAX2DTE2_LISIV|nr:RNA-guided endonuclease TnpB family protein [Listeria ivanovii]SDX39867.1 putative transposase [Listeria ivanovii]VEH47267.1 transposase, IS605 OrfB family [Listeria ivanovii subsp. londoniensis]